MPTTSTRKPQTNVVKTKPQSNFVPRTPEIEMVKIPAGSFMMGSENGNNDEKPAHKVTISKSFYMGKYEVTQAQWQAVMGNNPSYFKGCGGDCPVEQVSWNDAKKFIRTLNSLQNDYKYRLPSEAEWEYSARAEATKDDLDKFDSVAWYEENSDAKTHSVGQKQSNGWGLYDMHGNVREWVEDIYGFDYYSKSPIIDPKGQSYSLVDYWMRSCRGESWVSPIILIKSPSSTRDGNDPSLRNFSLGFRLAANDK
jgi:formylglycine-generating enzyme required for sulfatase activity